MVQVWQDTPDRHKLTSWHPGYVRRFLEQLGTDYDFLFLEYGANFVPNRRTYPHGMDWVVVGIEARSLRFSFVRDRGFVECTVGPSDDPSTSIDCYLAAAIVSQPHATVDQSGVRWVGISSVPSAIREFFSDLELAFSQEQRGETLARARQMTLLRSQHKVEVFEKSSEFSFLKNYADEPRTRPWQAASAFFAMAFLLFISPVVVPILYAKALLRRKRR